MEQTREGLRILAIEERLNAITKRLAEIERRLSALERSPPKSGQDRPRISHTYLNRAIMIARREYERQHR